MAPKTLEATYQGKARTQLYGDPAFTQAEEPEYMQTQQMAEPPAEEAQFEAEAEEAE